MDTAKAYLAWTNDNKEAFEDAKLIVALEDLRYGVSSNFEGKLLLPDGSSMPYTQIGVLLEEKAEGHRALLKSGRELPVGGFNGPFTFDMVDLYLGRGSPDYFVSGGFGNQDARIRVGTNESTLPFDLDFALSVAYANIMSQGFSDDAKKVIYDWKPGENSEPSLRMAKVLEKGKLTDVEIRFAGKCHQELGSRIQGLLDAEEEDPRFHEHADESKYTHALKHSKYSHDFVLMAAAKLGIRLSGRSRRTRNLGKQENCPTLFD